MAISNQLRSYRPSRSETDLLRKRSLDHLAARAAEVVTRPPSPTPPPNVVGTAAELDCKPVHIEELQATWELIETGAYTNKVDGIALPVIRNDEEEQNVEIELNGVVVEMPEGLLISLELLGVGPHNFLYVDEKFVRMSFRGIPIQDVKARGGMKIQTKAYPAVQPVAFLYWAVNTLLLPSRTDVSKFLLTPWGRTITNAVNSILMALMARPGINVSSPPVQLIVTVIGGARMLDLMIKETILRLLTEDKLKLSHTLFAFLICEICLLIGASIPFACLRLIEYHVLPAVFIAWTLGAPLIHKLWIIVGQVSKGHGLKGAIVGQVMWVFPILILLTVLTGDIVYRNNLKIDNLLTCQAAEVPAIGLGHQAGVDIGVIGEEGTRVML